MDYQKDAQKSEGLVKFVESQGTKTNPFGDNRVGERAYRRAERICAAVFVLTGHVSDTEPLKARAREKSLALLDEVLAVRDEMRSLNSPRAAALKASVRELISLARLLAVAGLVSFQNAAVIGEALDELASFLVASQRSTLSETASYAREDFLDVREAIAAPRPREHDEPLREQAHVQRKDAAAASPAVQRDAETASMSDKGHESNVRNGRSDAIREVLRVSGPIGIRDIASHLPEFSEKMIQRELAVLVKAGLVEKEGEKRWSRYGLKSGRTV